ncbi:cupin domain-containing protein [Alphaproteobacteria bacterium]|nr:cupin domain-containing protein [Alphaproteobacteria bacterium]
MTYEILSTPVNSPASLLFKQCLAEIDPDNRLLNSAMNEVGGYFLNKTEEIPLSNNLWDRVLDQTKNVKSPSKISDEYDPLLSQLPITLRSHLKNNEVKWKSFKDVKVASLLPKENNEKLELIHVMPGAKIPQHTHEGNESFLVLHGSYSDEYGSYKQGSVQVRSDDHDHTPVGHAQTGCIGLAYTHGKIKFSGKFGKLLNLIAN